MLSKKRDIIYVFIDSQNLHLGVSKDIYRNGKRIYEGWNLDYQKLYIFLIDKYRVRNIFMFFGYVPKYKDLYDNLQEIGYKLIFKETVRGFRGKPKGNVDVDLVLNASAVLVNEYDKAIIISGDGDFLPLYTYLDSKDKFLWVIVPNQKSGSSLLKKVESKVVYLEKYKERLRYKKIAHRSGRGRRSNPTT